VNFIEAACAIAKIDDPVQQAHEGLLAFGKRYMRVQELMAMDVADVRAWLKRMDEDDPEWL
jgi:hypothetical protein